MLAAYKNKAVPDPYKIGVPRTVSGLVLEVRLKKNLQVGSYNSCEHAITRVSHMLLRVIKFSLASIDRERVKAIDSHVYS